MRSQHPKILLIGLLCGTALFPCRSFAAPFTVFFAENGLGTFNTGVGGNIPLQATLTAGPIAGVMNVLTFNEGDYGVKGHLGDLDVLDPMGQESDIIRWDGAGHVYFFSLTGGNDGADTGLPNNRFLTFDTVTEDAKGNAQYTPKQDGPGFDANVMPVYSLNSAAVPSPEPGTWLFVATGCVGLLGYDWRRRRNGAA
jgi:hypothetical protein